MILTSEFTMADSARLRSEYNGPWISPTKCQCEYVYLLIYYLQHLSDLVSEQSNAQQINK